jgi:hypothetical protein
LLHEGGCVEIDDLTETYPSLQLSGEFKNWLDYSFKCKIKSNRSPGGGFITLDKLFMLVLETPAL